MRVVCPGCDRPFEFADYLAGLTMICKVCGERIPLPTTASSAEAMPAVLPRPVSESAIQDQPNATPHLAPQPLREGNQSNPADSGWVVELAKALLRTGVDAPAAERQLVSQGVSLAAASAVVETVLEERVRQQLQPLVRAERRRYVHRLLSSLLGAACVALAYWYFGPWSAGRTSFYVFMVVACIWFPDEMGVVVSKYSGIETPLGVMIRWCAWLVLILAGARLLWLGLDRG